MKGFGCFIVTLLNCLILRFLLISKGYTSQVREGRPAPRFPRGGRRETPKSGLSRPGSDFFPRNCKESQSPPGISWAVPSCRFSSRSLTATFSATGNDLLGWAVVTEGLL